MKTLLFFLLPALLCAQAEKGVTPTPHSALRTPHSTRAVVVGISDYQDPAIPDLQYAHRDAEAFAAWLRSPAGGGLDNDHLILLTNEKATNGQIVAALSWLYQESREGDLAIIYFSGHGDVDTKLAGQPGFLLTWDTPAQMYMAGACGLYYFQLVVNTLTEINKSRVLVITDACHSGKLAGNAFDGARITNANLSKLFGSETKILSCQPNEYSIEGSEWGGGRGAFSYHLVDGLYGMADMDRNGAVTASEIDRYLEDHVTREVSPMQQTPMLVGDRRAVVATVHPAEFAQWQQRKMAEPVRLSETDQKGMEEETLAKVDSSLRALYLAYKKALENKVFLEPADSCANAYYEKLMAVEELKPLYGTMTRNFAAALMDEGQQILNLLLLTDPKIVDNYYNTGQVDYRRHERYYHRAGELLGSGHFYFSTLKGKEMFFKAGWMKQSVNGFTPADNPKIARLKEAIQEGLTYDSLAAYLHFLMLDYPMSIFISPDSLRLYSDRLDQLAPQWVLGHTVVAGAFLGKFWREEIPDTTLDYAIGHCLRAHATDSNYVENYFYLAWLYECLGDYSKSTFYRPINVQKLLEKASGGQTLYAFEYHGLGNALWKLRRYQEGIDAMKMAMTISGGSRGDEGPSLVLMYCDLGKFEDALALKRQYKNGDIYHYYLRQDDKAEPIYRRRKNWYGLHSIYKGQGSYEKAAACLDSMLVDAPADPEIRLWHGDLMLKIGKNEIAKADFQSIARYDKFRFIKYDLRLRVYTVQMIALSRLKDSKKLRAIQRKVDQDFRKDGLYHFYRACYFANTGAPQKAMHHLMLAEQSNWRPDTALNIGNTAKDHFLDPLRQLPEFQAWEKRWSPPYKDYSNDNNGFK